MKAPVSDRSFAQLAHLTDLHQELGFQLRSNGPLIKGPTTLIAGRKAIELKDAAKRSTSVMYVAATGKPYPLQRAKHGSEAALTTFTAWNQPVTLTAPAGAVDLSKLEKRGG